MYTKNLQTLAENTIKEILPHGSGINGKWEWNYNDGKLTFKNIYEAMNEAGYYCHTVNFRIVIPVKSIGRKFHDVRFDQYRVYGNFSQSRCNCLDGLYEYLDELFVYPFEQTTKYKLIVDMDERGEFSAHVEDCFDCTVFEYDNSQEQNHESYDDEQDHESYLPDFGEISLVQDGFMKYPTDADGLEKYLVQMNVIPSGSSLTYNGK